MDTFRGDCSSVAVVVTECWLVVSRDGKVYVLCYPLNDFCTFQIISIELTLFSVCSPEAFILVGHRSLLNFILFYYSIQLCTATVSLTLTQLLLKALDAGPTILFCSTWITSSLIHIMPAKNRSVEPKEELNANKFPALFQSHFAGHVSRIHSQNIFKFTFLDFFCLSSTTTRPPLLWSMRINGIDFIHFCGSQEIHLNIIIFHTNLFIIT